MKESLQIWLPVFLMCFATLGSRAQSFRVQCPTSTITHPTAANNNSEPACNGPTTLTLGSGGYMGPTTNVNGAIKCQQVSGGDGYATMADGTQTFMFSFGPLSGLADIAAGQPGTEFPNVFNLLYPYKTPLRPGDPATADGATDYSTGTSVYPPGTATFTWNGAVGLTPDIPYVATIYDISESGHTVTDVIKNQSTSPNYFPDVSRLSPDPACLSVCEWIVFYGKTEGCLRLSLRTGARV